MKMIARMLFFGLMLLASYLLISALSGQEKTLPQVLKHAASHTMQQQLCKIPVLWRLGQLDPAFDLTPQQAEQAAHNAAQQWNNAFAMELFRYDSIDGFAINFRYDERQQQMLQQALLERNIQRYDATIDRRAAALQRQSGQLAQRQQEFEQQNQQFAADVAAFEQQAARAGSRNIATLQQQQQALQQRQQQLQQQAQQLNEQQAQLMREQNYLNDTVADRNALLPAQREIQTAEVGLMQIENGARTMTIFAYKTPAALQLTIAHEFGHALGLGHTDSAASVMHFSLNPAQSALTADDIAALQQQCGF